MEETKMSKKTTVYEMAECAVILALSIALFAVSEFIPWPAWLQGGGITLFGQVPIIVLSYRRGLKAGVPTALLLGVFEMITGLANFAWVKGAVSYVVVALFDYIFAFGVLGLGGMFRGIYAKSGQKSVLTATLVLGGLISSALRFVCHFLSGITVWSEYTQGNGGFTNLDSVIHGITKGSVIYSITYNGGYMLPETIITVIGCLAIALVIPKELTKYISKKSKEKVEKAE